MGTNSNKETSQLTKATKPTRANVCCTMIVNITMLVFSAMYAFNNPDDSDCYIHIDDLGVPVPTKEDYNDDYKNMGLRYKIIFICMFLLCIVNLSYAFVSLIFFMYGSKFMLNIASCLVGLSGVAQIVWMVYASIVIFSEDSRLCEEFMPKATMFIYVWLIIVYCFAGLLCCCSCMFICIVTSNKKK